MNEKPRVAVYCSAKDNLDISQIEAARLLGKAIGAAGCNLVYGGVDAGLMREVALGAKEGGAKVIGIVPQLRMEMASQLNDELVEVVGLSQRKEVMQHLAETFVVLPGGYGTLDEFMSAFAYINFNGLNKRIILCNFNCVFDEIIKQLHTMSDAGLMDARCLNCVSTVTSAKEMVECLSSILKKA